MITKEYKIYIKDELSEEEVQVLVDKATFYGVVSSYISVKIISVEMDKDLDQTDEETIKSLIKWIAHIGACEDVMKIQVISDYETSVIEDETKKLLGMDI